ncbi:MAG: PRC-barrel domain-containing protein [Daejeonella sp.]
MSSNNSDYNHLKELSKSNFEIARGEQDIRSWVVKNESGNILGEVDELIFDTNASKVIYVVLNLDKNELNLKERKILLPLEYAEIHEAYKNVVYKGLSPNAISVLPSYEKGIFTRNSIDLTRSTFLSGSGDGSKGGSKTAAFISSETYSEHHRLPDDLSRKIEKEDLHTKVHPSTGERPYSVIGVFEQAEQTEDVIEFLEGQGFQKEDISVSTRKTDLNYERHNRDDSAITSLFGSLFNNEDDVRKYKNASETNYVVAVDVPSSEVAEQAAKILDQHGSLNMRADQNAASEAPGNTRVFKRH